MRGAIIIATKKCAEERMKKSVVIVGGGGSVDAGVVYRACARTAGTGEGDLCLR
jgi:hypothetical protein